MRRYRWLFFNRKRRSLLNKTFFPENGKRWAGLLAGILTAALLCVLYLGYFQDMAWMFPLKEDTCETENFRRMSFPGEGLSAAFSYAEENGLSPWDCIAVWMLKNDFSVSENAVREMSGEEMEKQIGRAMGWKPEEFLQLREAYRRALAGLVYFPVAESVREEVKWVSFEDSWGDGRSFGGERKHEGCDIMGMEYPRGFYPVVSAAAGTVEKIGWLPQGGWRVGIRREDGGYDYYAHLYSYQEGIQAGDQVQAGEILGYMGDSGYSQTEGAVGNFPVHLHFGIYIETPHQEEQSVNPYDILRYLEKQKRMADYQ